jgi:peptidoglycan hydrolase-like protein with peptidoglycan-binding domain
MAIAAKSPMNATVPSSFAWLQFSKLPGKLLTRLLSLILGLAILSMADAALATLRQGDSGDAVRDLQNRLTAAQCYEGPMTGYFGSLTRSAVEACQQRYGIGVDGVVGPQTMAALNGGAPAATAPTAAASSGLQQGSRGGKVTELQQQLQKLGFYTGSIDGDFGPLTEQAVAKFQQTNSLTQTGVFGDREQQMLAASPVGQPSAAATDLTATIGRNQLTLGDAGKDVQTLQARLKELRHFDSAFTGYYGELTKVAVQSFQTAQKLPTSGIADRQTLQALGISIGNQASATVPTESGKASPFGGGFTSGSNGGTPITQRDPIPTQSFGSAQISQGGRFVVIIPKQNAAQFDTVKKLVPDATEGKSSIGNYIQAGSYSDQNAANQQSRFLQAYGLDARVAYR